MSSSRSRLFSSTSRADIRRRPQASRQYADDNQTLTELPEYEEPRFLLTAAGLQQLADLVNNPLNDKLLQHSKESVKILGNAVWSINERATSRKKRAAAIAEREAKRRRADDEEGNKRAAADVAQAKALAKKLEGEAGPLTLQLEQAMRNMLDIQAALQDEKQTLINLPEAINVIADEKRQRAAKAEGEDPEQEEEEDQEVAGVILFDVYQTECNKKATEYEQLNARQKYVTNNAYIDFKRQWHEGLFPDDEVPVPDPRTWFDRDGQPQHQVARNADGDDSDAEIQFASETRSFRCPLSLVPMTKPYTSRVCRHSFQKDAILSFIKGGNHRGTQQRCPQTGCEVMITLDDLYFDEPLLQRINRTIETEEDEDEADQTAQFRRGSQDREEEEEELSRDNEEEQEENHEGGGHIGEEEEGPADDEY
ncbi:zinc-finger of the MIZ type in Nse subunit-domain-containing protein [Coniella lustricola]|uniref:Zinc-finger of the MIZ type in Nse subunit-domain-containing protein n=1 Tax=Coniella lustricola TaxID=2025994 RepID=A0A2T3AM53_9PEZI|nr:zinc-finger of the MIZ type in Nse subunit-domain-containing protein [Coniella lustricola]